MITANTDFEKIIRSKIIKLAILQYGKEYEHGRNGPDTFDCAGLAWFLYRRLFDINIYRGGFGISTTTRIMTSPYGSLRLFNEKSLDKNLGLIKSGDILFFHRQSLEDDLPSENNYYPGHCGIYLGDNYFIQSSYIRKKVIISNFDDNPYWKQVLVGSKDVLDDPKILKMINIKSTNY